MQATCKCNHVCTLTHIGVETKDCQSGPQGLGLFLLGVNFDLLIEDRSVGPEKKSFLTVMGCICHSLTLAVATMKP